MIKSVVGSAQPFGSKKSFDYFNDTSSDKNIEQLISAAIGIISSMPLSSDESGSAAFIGINNALNRVISPNNNAVNFVFLVFIIFFFDFCFDMVIIAYGRMMFFVYFLISK